MYILYVAETLPVYVTVEVTRCQVLAGAKYQRMKHLYKKEVVFD